MKESHPPNRRAPTSADWTTLRQRLESARADLQRHADAVQRRELGEEPRPPATTSAPPARDTDILPQIIEFSVRGHAYAIEASFVEEVIALGDYALVPGAPGFVLGIVHHHDRAVSLIDLARFFGSSERGLPALRRVLVLSQPGSLLGLVADEISDTRRVRPDEISSPPAARTSLQAALCLGITRHGRIVLDTLRFLGAPELIAVKPHTLPPAGQRK